MFEPRLDVLDELPELRLPTYLTEDEYRDAEHLSHGERNSLVWTRAIAGQQEALAAAMSRTPGARYTAVGFFDPYRETQTPRTFPGFGVIVYTDSDTAPAQPLEPIMVAAQPFAVLPRPGVFQPQIIVTVRQQQAGRLACWATSRNGNRKGWLTAKHCAASLGKVVDTAPDCVDAALVSAGANIGKGSVRRAFAGLAPGLGVDMQLGSKQRIAKVLDVSTDFGMLKSGKFPLRFSTDYAGVPGDSGSLLAEQQSADPLGIYLGSFTPASNPNGPAAGIGLSVYQLEQMMDLEVYL